MQGFKPEALHTEHRLAGSLVAEKTPEASEKQARLQHSTSYGQAGGTHEHSPEQLPDNITHASFDVLRDTGPQSADGEPCRFRAKEITELQKRCIESCDLSLVVRSHRVSGRNLIQIKN
jgi:hypothetical protein